MLLLENGTQAANQPTTRTKIIHRVLESGNGMLKPLVLQRLLLLFNALLDFGNGQIADLGRFHRYERWDDSRSRYQERTFSTGT